MRLLSISLALYFALFAKADLPPPGKLVQFQVDKNQNFCLTAASNTDGAIVTSTPCSSSDNNGWTVTKGVYATGTITIFGNKCLDVINGANTDGTKLQIFTCGNGNKNQQWQVGSDLTIHWAGTNKCVDNTGGVMSNSNPTQIFTCATGSLNQKWVSSNTDDPNGTPAGGEVNFYIPHNGDINNKGCLTASNNANGAAVVFETCVFTNGPGLPGQLWTLSAGEPVSGKGTAGTLKVFGDKCLDVTGGATTSGTKLQIWTCGAGNPNQQWLANGDATIQWAGKSGQCVDLTNGAMTQGNPIQNWACSAGSLHQTWFTLQAFQNEQD